MSKYGNEKKFFVKFWVIFVSVSILNGPSLGLSMLAGNPGADPDSLVSKQRFGQEESLYT